MEMEAPFDGLLVLSTELTKGRLANVGARNIRETRQQQGRRKRERLKKQNNNFALASPFFLVHFCAVVARLQRETT